MKTRLFCISLITIMILGIVSLFSLAKRASVQAAIGSSNTGWIEHFDSETLGSRWTWVRENPAYWSLTANPGFLRLVTRGSLHQTSNNLENILLIPASDMNYRMITKITFSPTENYQRAGLIVYQNDDNYFQLTRVYSDGDNVRIKVEIGGVASYSYANGVSATTLYLRVDKIGDDYYGFYSIDGNEWDFVGQFNLSLSNTSIGLFAAHGSTLAEINADYDFFQFIPLTYNNSWEDDFNKSALDEAWSWVNEDPTHWSLGDNPGFLRITTQLGSLHSKVYNNLLLTEPPAGDYQITTKAIISPTENYQGAFMVVYDDDENFIHIGPRYGGSGNEINFRHRENDEYVENESISETATSVYLRIIKAGDLYSVYYSVDGTSFGFVGETTAAFISPKVGIYSQNGPSEKEIPSDYDFFRIENYVNRIYLPVTVK